MMRDLAGVRSDEVGLRRPLQSLCLNPLHPAAKCVLPRDPVISGSLATLQGGAPEASLPCSLDPCGYGLARLTLRRTNCGPTHKGLDPEAAVSAIVLSLGEGAHRERRVPAAPSREQSPIARLRSATAFSSL